MADEASDMPDELILADGLVRSLLDAGLTTMFGIGGTHTLQLLGAIERASAMEFVPARTELGAAYMAIGYARATGRPAVVLTSTGPGSLNVVGVLEDAAWSSTPLLHLTTSIGGDAFAGAVHETPHQQDILGLASKALVLLDARDVTGSVARAVAEAQRHPRGPVTLDVAAGKWGDTVSLRPVVSDHTEPQTDPDLGPVLDVLDRAKRPLFFVGGGAMFADHGRAVLALAERLGAPIITSYQARTIADSRHPLYVGPWATEASVQAMAAESDAAVVFGSKLSALGTGAWQLPLPEPTFWIDLAGGPHGRYSHLFHIRADAASVAMNLAARVEQRTAWADPATLRREVLAAKRTSHPDEMAFLEVLAAAPGGGRWLAADMSKAGFWAMKFLEAPEGELHAFSGYMAMGSALPMAIGMAVAVAEPVVAIVGDGAFQMSLAELATLASLRLPVTVIVIVDHAYGILRDNCAAVGGSASVGVDLWNPDLAMLATAFGIEVADVSDAEQLEAAMAVEAKAPRMILARQRFTREW